MFISIIIPSLKVAADSAATVLSTISIAGTQLSDIDREIEDMENDDNSDSDH